MDDFGFCFKAFIFESPNLENILMDVNGKSRGCHIELER